MSENNFSLDSLKNKIFKRYPVFTDAVKMGEVAEETAAAMITDTTMSGVDIALMNAGFKFIPHMAKPGQKLYRMQRGEQESLWYHPIDRTQAVFEEMMAKGMKTRIDFWCHKPGDAVYEVVSKLLELGYKVLLFSPDVRSLDELYMIEAKETGNPVIKKI